MDILVQSIGSSSKAVRNKSFDDENCSKSPGLAMSAAVSGNASGSDAASTSKTSEETVETLRESGNSKFKQADIAGARADYEKALALLPVPKLDEREENKSDHASGPRTPLLLNLALCCLRSSPVDAWRALEHCEEVLHFEPDNAKATYRKAKALMELGEETEAEWELVRACKLLPKDAAIRKDLECLRQRKREGKEREKAAYEGLFARGPGFASDDREAAQGKGAAVTEADYRDLYFHDGQDNPYEAADHPHEDAARLQAEGKLEDAVLAWEAALARSETQKDSSSHLDYAVELGRLLMDLNVDRLAMRCFDRAIQGESSTDTTSSGDADLHAEHRRRNALLLKAICLLNEAEGDPVAEVSTCLTAWLQAAQGKNTCTEEGKDEQLPIRDRIEKWVNDETCQAGTTQSVASGADACIARGLLDILTGSEGAPNMLALALRQKEEQGTDDTCFGSSSRRAVKWNMLGAVLANRQRYEHAFVAYREALRLRPHYPRALINLGIAQNACKGSDSTSLAAVGSYAKALRVLPAWAGEAVWQMLQQVASGGIAGGEEGGADRSGVYEELAEAVRLKNLTRVQDLLSSALPSPAVEGAAEASVADVEVALREAGL
eukprot:TRINITY_DN2836_c1_g3_i1.p1 TRINITY_DN2836_c1_g3~~TRINITY_DN2836_c1_g3_i1.p1  ORF type:complete len:610 (-),score=145.89 TRINITY_DN2836_c1_g3_i1:215-2044(-)